MGALDGWRFCPICGEAIEKIDDRVECRACGYVGYANAVPGAEAVCLDAQGRVLLGRRAHDPGAGLWDLPGGFLHEDELPLDGLRREIIARGVAEQGVTVIPNAVDPAAFAPSRSAGSRLVTFVPNWKHCIVAPPPARAATPSSAHAAPPANVAPLRNMLNEK